jgi:methionine-rich copper-binding protein CopC
MKNISTMVMTLTALSGAWTGAVFAHSELSSSTPADETVLQATPKELALTFSGAVRLTAVAVRSDADR